MPDRVASRFLAALALVQRPDPRAPSLFHNEAWSDLQCNSQLASWAKVTHAFVLQQQLAFTMLVRGDDPTAGRVAPCPAAFQALAACTDDLRAVWRQQRLSGNLADFQARLRPELEHATRCLTVSSPPRLNAADRDRAERAYDFVLTMLTAKGAEPASDADDHALLRRAVAAYAAAPNALDAAARADLERLALLFLDRDLVDLAAAARRLAAIAEQELDGEPHSADDQQFLDRLGSLVAGLHGYHGHSGRHPQDDHARIAPVALADDEKMLQVGVGRPEWLYVVLPIGGKPVLHRGAVLAFRERRAADVLTDAQWREVLDHAGGAAPAFNGSFRR